MNRLRLKASRIALILALSLFGSSGGTLLGAQTFAWARMTIGFLKKDAAPAALRKTFDGKHPCSLCKRLSRIHREEAPSGTPSSPPIRSAERLEGSIELAPGDFRIGSTSVDPGIPSRHFFPIPREDHSPSRNERPDPPPPRA